MSVQGSNSYCITLQHGRQQLCSCRKIAAESLQFHERLYTTIMQLQQNHSSSTHCTAGPSRRKTLSIKRQGQEPIYKKYKNRCNLGNPVHWRGKWFWTKQELASNMRFLSELTDYRRSDQVYLTTIIVAQQLGGCKLGWMQVGNPVHQSGEGFWDRTRACVEHEVSVGAYGLPPKQPGLSDNHNCCTTIGSL